VALHDASTIAAVIVEPMQGSSAVVVPPVGYLQKLREICTKHGILLIFDEVITGFGRLGENFGAQRLGVTPDIITFAKGVTNGIIPMGGIIVREEIFQKFMGAARRRMRSSSSTATPTPAIRWPPRAAMPRSTCCRRKDSSSARASWSRCSRTGSTP
jgi:adenosylmethionine-8-amino-7-oxononanoate aminotransferase